MAARSSNDNMPPGLVAQIERMERVQQVQGPKGTPYEASQLRFRALLMTGKGLAPVQIIQHVGQDFNSCATPWEQRFSPLAFGGFKASSGRSYYAMPIVDHNYTVIAHVITVRASWCWVPRFDFKPNMNAVKPYLREGIPVYVDSKPMAGWTEVGSSDNLKTVLVAIDGEVLQLQGASNLANIRVYDGWMLDALQLGGGVLTSLGRAAIKRSVKAIHRRTSQRKVTQLTGRTKVKAKQKARVTPKPKPRMGNSSYVRESGMPRDHFRASQATARDQNVIAMVRNTNNASTPHIARGCAAKPLPIKANTDQFGVVNVGTNKAHARAAMREGYYVVDADGVARRTVTAGSGKPAGAVTAPSGTIPRPGVEIQELKLDGAFWTVRPGQVITTGPPGPNIQPLVGDYDIMAVFPVDSLGSNVALHSLGSKTANDILGPYVARFKTTANNRFDRPRMMHGAQDQFGGFKGGVTVFYPDGRTLLLRTEDDVRKFYESIGRKHAKQSYNPNVNSHAHQAARQRGIESGDIVDMAAWKRAQSGIID